MPGSSCLFCAIVAGSESAHVVHPPDGSAMAFLDLRPLFKGHTLVVPTRHHETIEAIPASALGALAAVVRDVAGAVRRAMGAQGTFVAANNTVSQSVPHLHFHVVPRVKGDGLRGFFWPRTRYSDEAEAAAVAARIREELGAVTAARRA